MKSGSSVGALGRCLSRSSHVAFCAAVPLLVAAGPALAQQGHKLVVESVSERLAPLPPPPAAVRDEVEKMAIDVLELTPTFTLVQDSATTDLNTPGGGAQSSHPSAIGFFTDGISKGEELPAENQAPGIPPSGTEPIVYKGDIGTRKVGEPDLVFTSGICLGTGLLTDNDPLWAGIVVPDGLGVGAEGPNNGYSGGVPSETAYAFSELTDPPTPRFDIDFEDKAGLGDLDPARSGDAAALTFQVEVFERGFLEFTFVFATDEYPQQWTDVRDDTFVFLVTEGAGEPTNLALVWEAGTPEQLGIDSLIECPPQIFRKNATPPYPSTPLGMSPSRYDHNLVLIEDYFDHEYGGFTAPLKREHFVEPGVYTIKIVIMDVDDRYWDSTLFLPTDGIRLNTLPMQPGDYNGSGLVEQGDLDLALGNWGAPAIPPPAGWVQDAPEGSLVDQGEIDKVLGRWGEQQVFWKSDVNRDGQVTQEDGDIITANQGLEMCASIFEGDTTPDGDVDPDDLDTWQMEFNQSQAGTFDLVLRAAALCQYPPAPVPGEPLPGFGPRQPQAQPSPAPVAQHPPAPTSASVSSSAPISASEPQAGPAPMEAPSQTASSTLETRSPSLEEVLSTPNREANHHPRYDDIAEILAIAYEYYTGNRQRDAELIWLGVARVFGEEVLPEVIQITE
jgi:hypothetical protein